MEVGYSDEKKPARGGLVWVQGLAYLRRSSITVLGAGRSSGRVFSGSPSAMQLKTKDEEVEVQPVVPCSEVFLTRMTLPLLAQYAFAVCAAFTCNA